MWLKTDCFPFLTHTLLPTSCKYTSCSFQGHTNVVPDLKSCEILPNLNLVASLYGNFPSNGYWQSARHLEESHREEHVCSKKAILSTQKGFIFSCQESWEQIVVLHFGSCIERQSHRKEKDGGTVEFWRMFLFSWEY